MSNISRISGLLAESGLDWVVLSGADSVCFATGHVVGIEIGPNPFSGGPSMAFVGKDGSVGIVCANIEGEQIDGIPYETYVGFSCGTTDIANNFYLSAKKMTLRLGLKGKIGFERASFPASISDFLIGTMIPLDRELAHLRAIKTPSELAKLTFSAQCAAAGQYEARLRSVEGVTELDVLNRIRARMENMAGERCAFGGEYLSGAKNTSTLGAQPSARILQSGDPILADLGPRVHGYWGDSCGSFVIGAPPSEAYLTMHAAVRETLELAISELRPGLIVSEFDQKLRAFLQGRGYSYPHHSGHGIGTSVHEFPRLVPDEGAAIEENMVLMVEPSGYDPEVGGVRCEFMLQVTHTGCRIMAPFELKPNQF